MLLTDKDELQREVQSATDYILQLEEKCFTANKTALELLTRIRDHEAEVETLRSYIVELRTRIAVYIPVKSDVVDKTLSEYINNYPDRRKLKIMFLRMQEGVYEFGTRRVQVKVERNQLLVKVGGGWLQIDEFLDQYIPVELERYEKIDPLNKWRDSVANAPIKHAERSPVRRQNSPLK